MTATVTDQEGRRRAHEKSPGKEDGRRREKSAGAEIESHPFTREALEDQSREKPEQEGSRERHECDPSFQKAIDEKRVRGAVGALPPPPGPESESDDRQGDDGRGGPQAAAGQQGKTTRPDHLQHQGREAGEEEKQQEEPAARSGGALRGPPRRRAGSGPM